MTTTVFVYGTLRSGGSQNHRMGSAKLLGPAWTLGALFRIDWYPGLVPDPAGSPVRGDLYEVDDATLSALDEFEGPEYRRESLPVRLADGSSTTADLWVWYGPTAPERLLVCGDWLATCGGE